MLITFLAMLSDFGLFQKSLSIQNAKFLDSFHGLEDYCWLLHLYGLLWVENLHEGIIVLLQFHWWSLVVNSNLDVFVFLIK